MEVVGTAIPEVKIITTKRFGDHLPLAVPGYSRLLQNATDRSRLPHAVPSFLSLDGQHAIGALRVRSTRGHPEQWLVVSVKFLNDRARRG